MGISQWLVDTLRSYPELACFSRSAIGFWIGPKKIAGFALGTVTATLLAAVGIGQFGIALPGPIKSTFFLMFLFAVGYGVGPQFFRGLSKDGPQQIVFSLLVLVAVPGRPDRLREVRGARPRLRGRVCTPARRRSPRRSASPQTRSTASAWHPRSCKQYLDAIPVGYAVTYIFGTIGSAIVLAQIGPKLIGVDLPAACAEYEKQMGGGVGGLRRGRVFGVPEYRGARLPDRRARAGSTGKPVQRPVSGFAHLRRARPSRRPDHRSRRGTVLQAGDVVSISGPRAALVEKVESDRARGRGPGVARPAGDHARRLRHEQGGQRQDAARTCRHAGRRAACSCARSRATWSRCPSCRRPRSCAATCSLSSADAARRRRHQDAGSRRPSGRDHRHGVRRRPAS